MSARVVNSIALLRLSALGDVSHTLPLLRRIQAGLPDARITWIVGRIEAKLLTGIDGVRVVVVDKSRGLGAFSALKAELGGERFDALLHCQVALRANLVALAIGARRRIGFDWARARDLHSLTVSERIQCGQREHVVDALQRFADALGAPPSPIRWDFAIDDADRDGAEALLPGSEPTLLINACASHPLRNWRAERYAAVADHAVGRHGLRVALVGGPSAREREMAEAIKAHAREPVIDLVGRDTLKRLLAMCQKSVALLTPDSGPMHLANAVGTKVIGLHAASNLERSGPYSDRRWCVDRYDAAARRFRQRPAEGLRWGTKLEYPGVMDLIDTDAVIERLDSLMAWRQTDGDR